MSLSRRSSPEAVQFSPGGAAPASGWLARLRRVSAVVRRIIGVPDYDAYLAHMHRQFPDCTPLDPRTFERERLADKYTQPGSRCC
ncbi:MAG: YbdD/YjiX family protein [Gemmatimonadaceae bacterium]|nr:YbdD/YjiX family protein [Gemmatimonadaceae bacterium]